MEPQDKLGPRAHRVMAIAVVLGSTVVGLLLAEAAVRVILGAVKPKVSHHQLLCEPDPLLGWRKVPNARKRNVTAEYDVDAETCRADLDRFLEALRANDLIETDADADGRTPG